MNQFKSLIILSSLLIGSVSVAAPGFNLNFFTCSGTAEYGAVQIHGLQVAGNQVTLVYSVKGGKAITKKYLLTERVLNGTTDIRMPAYFIGATASGQKNDYEDVSLPHLGQYKQGIGSDIAFNDGNSRVFGSVSCR